MKSVVTGVIATLMLAGILSAVAAPKQSKVNAPVMVANGNPMPTCYPGDPNCH